MATRTDNLIREALADMLDFLSFKVRNGVMTQDDVQSVMSLIESSGKVIATADELADYYHQSTDNVRHVLHRKMMPAPKRKVYYDFCAFWRIVPEKWRHHYSLPAD